MKISFAILTLLTGFAIAAAVPEANADAETEATAVEHLFDEPIEARALDGNCVRCIRRGCGAPAVKCLRGVFPPRILICLAAKCGDDFVRCCT